MLFVVFLALFFPVVMYAYQEGLNLRSGLFLLAETVLYAIILYLFFNTTYTIEGKILSIKCGFITYKPIDIMTIKSIAKSSNIISAPAASFDRIEISYGKYDEVILSPKDKHLFAQHLVSINPNIQNKLNF